MPYTQRKTSSRKISPYYIVRALFRVEGQFKRFVKPGITIRSFLDKGNV